MSPSWPDSSGFCGGFTTASVAQSWRRACTSSARPPARRSAASRSCRSWRRRNMYAPPALWPSSCWSRSSEARSRAASSSAARSTVSFTPHSSRPSRTSRAVSRSGRRSVRIWAAPCSSVKIVQMRSGTIVPALSARSSTVSCSRATRSSQSRSFRLRRSASSPNSARGARLTSTASPSASIRPTGEPGTSPVGAGVGSAREVAEAGASPRGVGGSAREVAEAGASARGVGGASATAARRSSGPARRASAAFSSARFSSSTASASARASRSGARAAAQRSSSSGTARLLAALLLPAGLLAAPLLAALLQADPLLQPLEALAQLAVLPLQLFAIAVVTLHRLQRRVRLPPVDAHLASPVDRRDQQPQLDRQQLDVQQVDLDVARDDDALVEHPLEDVGEVGALRGPSRETGRSAAGKVGPLHSSPLLGLAAHEPLRALVSQEPAAVVQLHHVGGEQVGRAR